MNKNKVASELLKVAKDLITAGMFSKVVRIYDQVDKSQLSGIKKAARKNRGKVKTKSVGFGDIAVSVTFNDNFPDSYAKNDAESFDDAVRNLHLQPFTGIPSMVGL